MSKQFSIVHEQARRSCMDYLQGLDTSDGIEVVFRQRTVSKTLQQLAGIHAAWLKWESERVGKSTKKIKQEWKAEYLARIYAAKPIGDIQEMWVERLIEIQQMITNYGALLRNADELLEKHLNRLSLAWATKEQMREFMNTLQQDYIDEGHPLPILDPEWRRWFG